MIGRLSKISQNLGQISGTLFAGLCFCLVANSVAAQQSLRQVQLEAIDGSVTIQGELIDFEDGVFSVQTQLGLVQIGEEDVICTGPGCPDADIDAMPESSTDAAIRLLSPEDGTEIVGTLTEFSDGIYTVQTALGAVQIDAEAVDCFGAACPDVMRVDPNFTIAGGVYALQGLFPELLRGFAQENGYIYDVANNRVRLISAQDGSIVASIGFEAAANLGAFAALASKTADIAVVDEALPPIMWENVAKEYSVAFDAQVFITHEDNPVRDLTLDDLGQIWSGQAQSWEPFGGGDFPIAVHMTREEAGRIPAVFVNAVLNGAEPGEAVTVHESAKDVTNAVLNDRNAVGVVDRVSAELARSRVIDLRKSCGLITSPSDFELKVENYPLSRPVLAYVPTTGAHPIAQQFLAWTETDTAQLRVSDAGFGGDKLQRMKLRDMGIGIVQTTAADEFNPVQFSSMIRELSAADRLSITFRFGTSSSQLDSESVAFVQELAARLRANEFEGLEVLLVGFADSQGGANRNTDLAQNRAETVRQILLNEFDAETAARLNIQALSFGEQMPLSCNTDDAGRANNRRVEIWVRPL